MSTKTKGLAFEKLTLNAHKKTDWVTISVGIILAVSIIAVVLSAHNLGIQLQ